MHDPSVQQAISIITLALSECGPSFLVGLITGSIWIHRSIEKTNGQAAQMDTARRSAVTLTQTLIWVTLGFTKPCLVLKQLMAQVCCHQHCPLDITDCGQVIGRNHAI